MTKRLLSTVVTLVLSGWVSVNLQAALPVKPLLPFCDSICLAPAASACMIDRFGQGAQGPNYTSALRSCEREAEAGSANAQALLAELYFLGLGTPQNFLAAAHWYRAAATQAHPHAQQMLQEMARLHLIPLTESLAVR